MCLQVHLLGLGPCLAGKNPPPLESGNLLTDLTPLITPSLLASTYNTLLSPLINNTAPTLVPIDLQSLAYSAALSDSSLVI